LVEILALKKLDGVGRVAGGEVVGVPEARNVCGHELHLMRVRLGGGEPDPPNEIGHGHQGKGDQAGPGQQPPRGFSHGRRKLF
jgi:hypothetical protein